MKMVNNIGISERDVAIQNGFTYYNTGQPCKKGHTAARYASTGVCVQCNRDRSKNNCNKSRYAKYNLGLGLENLMIGVHPDDKETIIAFNKALLFDRGIY
jgi:hypothetical protein